MVTTCNYFFFSGYFFTTLFLSLSLSFSYGTAEPCAKEKKSHPQQFWPTPIQGIMAKKPFCLPHAWSECLHPNQGSLAQCPRQNSKGSPSESHRRLPLWNGVWGMFRVDHDGSDSSEFWSLLVRDIICFRFQIYHIQHEGGIFDVQSSIDWITGNDSLSMFWRTFQEEAKSRGQKKQLQLL